MKNFPHGSNQRNETFNDNEMSAKNNIIFHGSLVCEDDLTININGTNFTISSIIERLAALESNSGGSSNTGSSGNQEDPGSTRTTAPSPGLISAPVFPIHGMPQPASHLILSRK